MNKARKIAIAGATGMVGQSFLKLLEQDFFQDSEISLLASSNSAGKEINFRGKNHKVEDLSKFNSGKIVANGNHSELLQKSEIYKNFYEKQLRKD